MEHGIHVPDCAYTAILTIGYGTRSFEEFIALLRQNNVRYLVDVRTRPFSKFRPDFSQGPLRPLLRRIGIIYVFMGDALGGLPSDPSCYIDGKVDYQTVRQRGWFNDGLARLEAGWRAGHRIALMCAELSPDRCHRCKLIGEALTAREVAVMHIDERGAVISHQIAMTRVNAGQATLFDVGLTSRRKHRAVHDEQSA